MMVPIQVIRWYRMQCYDGTDSCAIVVPIRRYCQRVAIINKTPYSEAQIRLQFNALVRQFKNSTKYDNVEEYIPTIDESEDINYEMSMNHKEYEANFYQKSRIEGDSIKWKEQFKLSLLKEVPNATVENIEDGCKVMFEFGKLIGKMEKHVWFKIARKGV